MSKILSVIIPTYNEASNIGRLLGCINELSYLNNQAIEVIVVDGGSTDKTVEVASSFSRVIVRHSQKGRAKQLNLGARNAVGEILYFLHCDSVPPKHFDYVILKAINEGADAGCFRLKFDKFHLLTFISCFFTRFNFPVCRGGDQSLFIQKKLFNYLGGYNESYQIYEDNDLTDRICKKFNFRVLPFYIRTSSRRFKTNGYFKLMYHFSVIHFKKNVLKSSPENLYQYYLKSIK